MGISLYDVIIMTMTAAFKKKVGYIFLAYIFISGVFMIYYVVSPCDKWDENPCNQCWDNDQQCEVSCHHPFATGSSGFDTNVTANWMVGDDFGDNKKEVE